MSNHELQKKIAEIMRRLARLQAASRGELDAKKVKVKRHYVPGFWVSKHDRVIYMKPKPTRRAA